MIACAKLRVVDLALLNLANESLGGHRGAPGVVHQEEAAYYIENSKMVKSQNNKPSFIFILFCFRTRIITSVVTAICIVVFMKATDNGPSTICDFFSQLLYPFYMRLASSIASEDESSQMPSQSESIGHR